jgi:tubulin epsilon
MEPGVLNGIEKSRIGSLFDSHQIIKSDSGSGNNWAQGYHHYGSIYRDQILDSLRKEAEWYEIIIMKV